MNQILTLREWDFFLSLLRETCLPKCQGESQVPRRKHYRPLSWEERGVQSSSLPFFHLLTCLMCQPGIRINKTKSLFQRTLQPIGGPRSVKRVTGAGQVVCPFRPQQKRESRKTDHSKVPQHAGAPGSYIPVCFPDFCFSLCLRVMLSLSRLRFSWKNLVCF